MVCNIVLCYKCGYIIVTCTLKFKDALAAIRSVYDDSIQSSSSTHDVYHITVQQSTESITSDTHVRAYFTNVSLYTSSIAIMHADQHWIISGTD